LAQLSEARFCAVIARTGWKAGRILLLCAATPPAFAECDWREDFVGRGLDGFGYALTVHDDGSASQRYVGGRFVEAGGQTVNRLARWNGALWERLGSGSLNSVNGEVYALAEFDDGSGKALYATGAFLNSGELQTQRIAKWQRSEASQFAIGFEAGE
jgi:hypothetical protein